MEGYFNKQTKIKDFDKYVEKHLTSMQKKLKEVEGAFTQYNNGINHILNKRSREAVAIEDSDILLTAENTMQLETQPLMSVAHDAVVGVSEDNDIEERPTKRARFAFKATPLEQVQTSHLLSHNYDLTVFKQKPRLASAVVNSDDITQTPVLAVIIN